MNIYRIRNSNREIMSGHITREGACIALREHQTQKGDFIYVEEVDVTDTVLYAFAAVFALITFAMLAWPK
jgi:hypothetical protein